MTTPIYPIVKRMRRGCAAIALLCLSGTATAQDWPSRPLKLMVPLAAGSTADIVSRTVAAELSARLGQTVVVENKPGAGGTIAMADVARAAPDGYTISFASQGTLVFNQALYAKPGYDSLKDFAPIVLTGGVSNVMIVPPTSTATNPRDVIAQAKAKPGSMTFSSGGNGTSHHLSGVLFAQLTQTEWTHVPYKGAPQGVLAVMNGEVQAGWFNTPTVIGQIRGGKVKALAVTSRTRSNLLPELPTLDAAGVPGYEVNTWFGFVAPAGTPAPIVNRLNSEISAILADARVNKVLLEQGFDLAPANTPESFSQLVRTELAKWTPVVKASGAKVD